MAAVAMAVASPAAAEWRRAESEHFVVYSEGRESALREYVRKLEVFDRVLRVEISAQRETVRKLPIYLVGNETAMRQIHPYLPRQAAGVYMATTEDIFAVALRGREDDYMMHEYVHHVMFQNFAGAYPAWLVEGFAEYYAATEINNGSILVGGFNEGRVATLMYLNWIPLRDLLTKPLSETRGESRDTYYPMAWLLTHWFLGNPERRPMLQAYLNAVASGTPSLDAMEAATGITIDDLQSTLRRYFSSSAPQRRYTGIDQSVEMTVTVLPPSADDLLLINQRLRVGASDEERPQVAAEVRRKAARHADDPLALLALGHAELHFGDPVAGEAVLTRLLELQPDHVEALQLMATRQFELATERPDEQTALMGRARAFLARAYRADDANYYTLMLLGQSREGAAGYPNANDIETWLQAFELSPQLAGSRLGLARALMQAGRNQDAAILLPPLANAPHGGAAATLAREMLDRALAGEAPVSEAEITAATERQVEEGGDEGIPPEGPAPDEGETPSEARAGFAPA